MMLEEDGRDRAGEDLGEGERDHAVLGSSPVKAEVKEEVAGYSSSEDDEAPLWRGPGFSKPNKLQVKLRARGLKRKRDSGSEDDSWWAGWMAGREEQSLLPTSTPLPGRGEGPRLEGTSLERVIETPVGAVQDVVDHLLAQAGHELQVSEGGDGRDRAGEGSSGRAS